MEVNAGYKLTEVGVIPDDWEVKRLGELFEITSSKRVFQSEWRSYGVPFYRAREVVVLGETGFVENDLFISSEMYEAFKRQYGVPGRGDMLVTGVGTLGKTYVVSGDHEFYFKDGNIIWFKIGERVSSEFLRQLYLTPTVISQVGEGSAGTTVGTYTITAAKNTVIPYPPLSEQRAIATALGDVDVLLRGLDRLIAKKRDLKLTTVQQLLTGQTRLHGFQGEWEVKRLGNYARFLRNGAYSRAQLSDDSSLKYLHYGDVHSADGVVLNPSVTSMPGLPRDVAQTLDRLTDGDTVFVDASEDLDGVGKSVEIAGVSKVEVVAGLHTIAARFDKSVLADGFKAYLQFCPEFRAHLRRLAAGTKVYATSRAHIASAEVRLPAVDEQTAIAAVLSDMDAELSALEARRDKSHALKQAMMQELLPGKTRLV